MKKILLALSLLFTILLSSQNTLQGEIFYKVSLKPFSEQQIDSLFKKQKTIKIAQPHVRKMLRNSKDIVGVLAFSKNESLYKIVDKMKNEGNKNMNMTFMVVGGNNSYYTNSIKKDYFKEISGGEPLRVGLLQAKWSITQETKKIGKYLCFKAISYRKTRKNRPAVKTTAWFAPVIPVSFGPEFFFGLPGLILEVSYKNISIKATKIILNPSKKIAIKKPTKGKRITHEEYEEFNKNFFKNIRK